MDRVMVYRAFTGFLLFLHFVMTRGFAILILGSWIWYMSSSFAFVSEEIAFGIQGLLTSLGASQFLNFLIMESKPENIVLFMIVLAPLYVIFSFILYPLRHRWLSRTMKMLVIHFLAIITLYFLAWSAEDFFRQLMETALVMRNVISAFLDTIGFSGLLDSLFNFFGYSDGAKMVKTSILFMKPKTILSIIMITIFFYLLYELPSLMRVLSGGNKKILTGESQAALFRK